MGVTLTNVTIDGSVTLESVFVPTAPTIGTAERVSGSGTEIDVPYTASANNGGRVITSYTAVSNPGNITGTISQASSGTIRVGGLTQGTAYTFVVYATNGVGNSPNSAASNSVTPAIVPTAPTIGTPLNVSGSGTEIDVPYTASSSNGGNAIISYTATSTPGSITGTLSQASSGTIRVSGLTQGTSYTFVVKATNSIGDSPNSAASSAIIAGIVPTAPTVGTVIRVSGSGTQLDVPYTASSSNGGTTIISYTATSTPGSLTGTISQASSGTIRVSGLTQGTNYTFVVKATNAVGDSPNSAASNSLAPAVVPTAPTIGTAIRVSGSGTSIDVPYTANSNGGNAITSYTATSTPGSITGTLSQASSGTIRVSGLTQGTSYTFVVYATNDVGNSPNSAVSNAIIPATVPSAPTIGTASRVSGSSTQIDITYTASSSDGGNAITSYTATSTPGSITGTISQASSGTIRVSGLTAGTSYTFVVKATNAVGDSPNSSASNSIIPAGVPDAPTIGTPSLVSGSGTQIDITYTAPINDGGNAITSYTAVSTPGSITGTLSQASSGTIRVSGLTAGTSYTFVVYATNFIGNSPNSSASSAIIPATIPSAPTIGTVTVLSNTSVGVAYTASSNGGNTVTSYTAVSTPGNITGTASQASSGSITVTGLTTGTSYTFVVYATNSLGNSPNSASSSPKIPSAIPSAPSIGTVTSTYSIVTVPFTAPANGGSPITSHTAVSYPDYITSTINQSSSGNIVFNNSSLVRNEIYSFRVFATNDAGNSPYSTASNMITYLGNPINETAYIAPGAYTWVAPAGVTCVSAIAVGGGGGADSQLGGRPGGGGGGLGYKNSIAVTPGSGYPVAVGYANVQANGGDSYFYSACIVKGGGGFHITPTGIANGGTYVGDGGGNGGNGGELGGNRQGAGGGGSGGYSGTGGTGGSSPGCVQQPGTAGTGGAGGGGGAGFSWYSGGGGGGTGLYGVGTSGNGGAAGPPSPTSGSGGVGVGGGGGSNGANGTTGGKWISGYGGNYGGGAGGGSRNSPVPSSSGGNGGVRVIWGTGRSFPSTNAGAVFGAGNVPCTPTIGTVTTSTGTVTVPFTAAGDGGNAITQHRAISTPGNIVAVLNQASSGNIQYINDLLTANTSYTFKVYAVNAIGAGPQSSASNSITYPGGTVSQQQYTLPGTYTWVAPTGVTSVSAVAVGGGGGGGFGWNSTSAHGGGGGGLGWKNNIPVTPGQFYPVVVGANPYNQQNGGDSYFISNTTVKGGGGIGATHNPDYNMLGGGFVGDGGGNGGNGAAQNGISAGGGGGAGGYSGDGGHSGLHTGTCATANGGANGSGGGGGGGAKAGGWQQSGGGGGVGIYGEGASGTGGAYPSGFGTGGSNGANGTTWVTSGGNYGGGGGGVVYSSGGQVGTGGSGAVRIIWGTGRSFPSTNTGNV